MMMSVTAVTALLLCVSFLQPISGHVALLDPPARNVLWRSGYNQLPKHEDDDYLLCQEKPGKRCPPCGDSPDSPKPLAHQAGGQWALGIIGRNYTVGESVRVSVAVTNSHGGHMEFKLCPNNDVTKPVTQRCLDRHPLEVKGYSDGKVPVTAPYQSTQNIDVEVLLPRDMTCDQCVMQMSQYAEQFKPSNVMFRNCADIGIHDPRASASPASGGSTSSSSSNRSSKKSSTSTFGSLSGFGSFPRRQSSNRASSSRNRQRRPDSNQSVFFDQSSARGGPSPFPHFSTPKQGPSFIHSQTQFSNQPSSLGFSQPPRTSSSFGHLPSQQRFSSQGPQQLYTQQSVQPQQFFQQQQFTTVDRIPSSKFQNNHVRSERRPTPILFNSSPSAQQLSSRKFQSHPISSQFPSPNFSGTNVAIQFPAPKQVTFSGSHSIKNSRNVNFGVNQGFSGFSSTGGKTDFQTRSKSMFPVHQPQVYTGF